MLGGVLSVGVAIALVVIGVNALAGAGDAEPGGSGRAGPAATRATEHQKRPSPQPAEVLSKQGFADLVAAVKAETGTTMVFDATIYPGYAVLQLPVDRETKRQAYHHWDGRTLDPKDSFGKSAKPRLDLATVSVPGMLSLSARIRGLVDEPNSWYVVLHAPEPSDGAAMYAYASNKYTEGGYLSADLTGRQIREVTW